MSQVGHLQEHEVNFGDFVCTHSQIQFRPSSKLAV
jgi:hypothetical protein